MLPAVCVLSAVWPNTPTTQATLYQRPDCWRRFLVLLVIDVIKTPGTYFNNWLQLSCRSSKFSSSFLATSVLLYALLDPIRELAKCFKYFSDKHCKQVATCSTFPSANDVIDLCWILYNKSLIVATFFFQRTAAFELFCCSTYLHSPSLQFSCFRKTEAKNKCFAATLIWQLVIHSCVIFAYVISRRNGENNSLLAGISFPPSLPALAPGSGPRASLAPKTPLPFLFKRLVLLPCSTTSLAVLHGSSSTWFQTSATAVLNSIHK